MDSHFVKNLAFCLVCIWFGAFTFYAGLVVPIGSEIIGESQQGFITQKVSVWLNVLSTLAGLGLILWVSRERTQLLVKILVGLFCLMSISLFFQHISLSNMLDPLNYEVVDKRSFYPAHRIYLLTSTVLWLISVFFLSKFIFGKT